MSRTGPGDRQDRALLGVLLGLHVVLLLALPVAAWSVAGFLRRTGLDSGGPLGLVSLLAGITILAELGLLVRARRVYGRLRPPRRAPGGPAGPKTPVDSGGM